MKKIFCVALLTALFPVLVSWANDAWEKEGNYYFLTKNSKDYFSANGPDVWGDYGRLDLSGNNPSPAKPLRNILVSDSWLSDIPFSDIFALTLKSGDTLEAGPAKKNY
jgi:hypothetical protein